jgi:c-di-GMP-binding flagellar brake protein YcgR
MAQSLPLERRRSHRHESHHAVTVKTAEREIKAESLNLSDTGMFVVSPCPVLVSTPVEVFFTFYVQGLLRCVVQIQAEGTVVRVEPLEERKFGIAMQFRRIRFG